MTEQPFDLIILDQRIPSADDVLDADVTHGRAVFEQARKMVPDTPVYFLTGLPMEDDYVDQLIHEGTRSDIFGTRAPVPLVARFQKSTMSPFYEAAAKLASEAHITDEIEINRRGAQISLTPSEARLIRVFARQHNGVCADLSVLAGGLSSSRVFRIDVRDSSGGVRISSACKIGPSDVIVGEIRSFEHEVVRLPAGSYAPLIPGTLPQVGTNRGAFYRLLDGYDRSLFDLLKVSSKQAATVVSAIKASQQPWFRNARPERRRIKELLSLVVDSSKIAQIHEQITTFDWEPFEEREVLVNFCTRHGDLHGGNVLVNSAGQSMMLDYGAIGEYPSAFDAVTLELCVYFHPNVRDILLLDRSSVDIDWFDLELFCARTMVPEFTQATRAWAHAEGFGEREILACCYIYALRQLQFDGTDKVLALALAEGIVNRAERSW
ncbi:hypothetical protein QWJ07_21685 [Frankia sp. RB7]|nr:hypothetical protein [Frankia sp. RB7]